VRQGIVPASFIITRCGFYYSRQGPQGGIPCDKRLYIVMVQDPSRATEVSFLKMLFDSALMEQMSVSAKEIQNVQAKAADLRKELPLAISELSRTRDILADEEQEIAAVNSSINLGEINATRADIDSLMAFMGQASGQSASAISELQALRENISSEELSLQGDFGSFRGKLYSIQAGIAGAEAKRNAYSSKLASYEARLARAIYYAESAYSYANAAYAAAPSAATAGALDQVTAMRNELYSAQSDLQLAKAELDSINFATMKKETADATTYVLSSQQKTSNASFAARAKIDSAAASLGQFSAASQEIHGTLSKARSRTSQIYSSAEQAKARLGELKAGMSEAVRKTYQTQSKLSSSNALLVKFTAISPEDFMPPKIEEGKFVRSKSQLLFTFPFLVMVNIALFAVLFPIVMTSKLQEHGVEDRLRQGGGQLSFIVGRFAGDYAIVAFQTMLFFMFAVVFFGVVQIYTFQIFLQMATVLFVAIPFTALGFLLSRIVKKVATGLLLSLLLFIPMVFLSGKLLPFSFMDLPIRIVGSIQMFTVSLNLLELSFFRCSAEWCGPVNYAAGIIYLGALTSLFLGLSLVLWFLSSSPGRARFGKTLSG
ncbi:MAG: hypothetical protein WC263_03805, partial [Candidatus Micrarchaeia archaeon]|jgi:ABC-type multidrug transport system permease subunit